MSNVKKRVQSYRIKDLNSNDYVIDQSPTRQHDLKMTQNNVGRMNPSQLIRVANHNECSQIALTIKFENMAEQWFEEYAELNHRDTTLQRERNLCKRTYLAIGHMFLDEITTRDIQLFINDLAKYGVNMDNGKPLSYKTVRHHLSFVSDVFEYAIRMDIINYNPCLKVIVPKNIQNRSSKDNEKRIYTKEQARKFLELLSEAPTMYRVYLTLCMFTGCRRAELLGLEWKDFNYEKQTVHIVRTSNYSKWKGMYTDKPKTKRSNRIIALPAEVLELVKKFKKERDVYIGHMGKFWSETERLFTTPDGRPMHANTPYSWLKHFCNKNNFPFYGIHSFRHFFASIEIAAGIDPVTVAAVLGHSTPQTTLTIYSHYFQEARIKAEKAISELIGIKDVPNPSELRDNEKQTLSLLRELNNEGQDAAIAMIADLVTQGKYNLREKD